MLEAVKPHALGPGHGNLANWRTAKPGIERIVVDVLRKYGALEPAPKATAIRDCQKEAKDESRSSNGDSSNAACGIALTIAVWPKSGRGKRVDDLEPPVAERPPASLTLPPFDGAFFFESRLNRAARVIIEL